MAAIYTYAIQASDDGEIWMAEEGYLGTEEDEYDRGAEKFGQTVLNNYLLDVANDAGLPLGEFGSEPVAQTRIVVWNGEQQDSVSMAAAVINA